MEPTELVTVTTFFNPIEAQIVKNALEAEGIRSFIQGGNQASEVGVPALKIQLQVPADDARRAREFIEDHERRRKENQD